MATTMMCPNVKPDCFRWECRHSYPHPQNECCTHERLAICPETHKFLECKDASTFKVKRVPYTKGRFKASKIWGYLESDKPISISEALIYWTWLVLFIYAYWRYLAPIGEYMRKTDGYHIHILQLIA